jgi:hypothetical protein
LHVALAVHLDAKTLRVRVAQVLAASAPKLRESAARAESACSLVSERRLRGARCETADARERAFCAAWGEAGGGESARGGRGASEGPAGGRTFDPESALRLPASGARPGRSCVRAAISPLKRDAVAAQRPDTKRQRHHKRLPSALSEAGSPYAANVAAWVLPPGKRND